MTRTKTLNIEKTEETAKITTIRQIFHLYVALLLLNLADYLTTAYLISEYGFEVEANPLMYAALVWYGSSSILLILKSLVFALILWGLIVIQRNAENYDLKRFRRLRNIFAVGTVGFLVLIAWNSFLSINTYLHV